MSEDASTSLSRAEFDIENNWVGKGGDKWSIIPNSMCKTNTSLFITIFVKSLLSSSGLSVSGKKHEKKTRQRILQSLCPSLYFLFLFFAFFFYCSGFCHTWTWISHSALHFNFSLIQILLCCPQAPFWTQRNHPKISFYQALSLSHSAFYISSLCNAIIILFFLFSWSGRGSTAHCSRHCPAYALEVKNLLRTKLHVVSCGGS